MTIKYVCISDLHCGAENSLLTPRHVMKDPAVPLADAFGAAMRMTLAEFEQETNPDLILLGDMLDLSFATPEATSRVLSQFLRKLFLTASEEPGMPFNEIIFLPGNHDHELWTAARFTRTTQAPDKASVWSHTSPAFDPPGTSTETELLNDVFALAGIETRVHAYYPNFGLHNADLDRCVFFHHGHFFESLYSAMSRLAAAMSGGPGIPHTLEELEAANGAWIDFTFSTIGDTGRLGSDLTLAYQFLLTGGASAFFQHRLARLLTDAVLDRVPIPKVGDAASIVNRIAAGVVDTVVGEFSQLSRFSYNTSMVPSTTEGLKTYMTGPTLKQILHETGLDTPPEDFTLIFGHTHKPFEDRLTVDGYGAAMGIVNTGGWVLDTSLLSTVEGASAVFIDDELNVAVLRLFAPPANGDTAGVFVTGVDGKTTDNPLVHKLHKIVTTTTSSHWDAVAQAAAQAYRDKQARVIEICAEADAQAHARETLL